MLRKICIVQIKPRKHVPDHADYSAPTRQHGLDHTDREYICPGKTHAKWGPAIQIMCEILLPPLALGPQSNTQGPSCTPQQGSVCAGRAREAPCDELYGCCSQSWDMKLPLLINYCKKKTNRGFPHRFLSVRFSDRCLRRFGVRAHLIGLKNICFQKIKNQKFPFDWSECQHAAHGDFDISEILFSAKKS